MQLSIKILIPVTVVASLTAAFIPELQAWLALSWSGIIHYHLWQFITYLFIEPGAPSFSLLLQLGFNMYLLWLFGSSLIERSGTRQFLALYFGAGIFAGLAALLPLAYSHSALAGATTAVYAILVAWMMLNQGAQLLLFFALPFRAQWLVVALVAISLFFSLSSGNWVFALSLSASCLFGYLFAIITWREQGPFAVLHPFERKLLRLLEKKSPPYRHSKIYDIKSGSPVLDDDQFMDAMLERISRLGEDSLTSQEKKRMQSISSKKKL